MDAEPTSAAVQRYLDELAADSPAEAVVRALLGRAVHRLEKLCATLLYRSYPRLTRPPANLQPDELLGAVVERLLKALREARLDGSHFAVGVHHADRDGVRPDRLANVGGVDTSMRVHGQIGRGEALRLECLHRTQHRVMLDGRRDQVAATPGEREAFDLVQVQGLSQAEAAQVLEVSVATVNRRLNRGLQLLTATLADLYPGEESPGTP